MKSTIPAPLFFHLNSIGLDGEDAVLATAFYSRRGLKSIRVRAKCVILLFRLDLHSTVEWERGSIDPWALSDFIQDLSQSGTRVSLFSSADAHAKFYIGQKAALVGSSNLTMNGFGGGPELVYRIQGDRLAAFKREWIGYQGLLNEVANGDLLEYVNKHKERVSRIKGSSGSDRLPRARRSQYAHMGNYEHFKRWLSRQSSEAAGTILERANGAGKLSGHIHRNFYGIRQLFIAYNEIMKEMLDQHPDKYKLSKDISTEALIKDFVKGMAVDEDNFVVERWKTYLPVECGGRAKRHGGTIGNLNRMLPLVARYLKRTILSK